MTQSDFTIKFKHLPLTIPYEFELEFDELPDTTKIAVQSLKQKEHPMHHRLESRQTTNLTTRPQLSSELEKTKSVGQRLFSWISNTHVSIWTSVQVFKSIRYCLSLGTHSKQTRDVTDRTLDELTGSGHLSKTIRALSPTVAGWLQEKLISLKFHAGINAFLKGENHTLQTFVEVLLPVIFANIGKNVRECAGDDGVHQKTVSLVDMISFIGEIINKHLPYINHRLEAIERIPEGEKRDRAICHVFSRLVDEFLTIALPNGINELPLIKVPVVSEHYWKFTQKQIFPVIFYEAYRQFADPISESKKDILLKKQGGEALVSLAQMAGAKAAELIPAILADAKIQTNGSEIRVIDESPLVAEIVKCFSTLLQGSDPLKKWISGWFTKELVKFGKSDNLDLQQFWKLLGGYLEPMLIHVFVSISHYDGSLEKIKGRIPDALGIIFIRLLSVCSRFFNDNRNKIQHRIDQLKLTRSNIREDKELVGLFKPLASDLLRLLGLDDPAKLPLPAFIKESVVNQLQELAPNFLLRQYLAMTNANAHDKKAGKNLRALLFDPRNLEDPEIAVQIVSALYMNKESAALNMFHEFYRALWQESGTERIAKTLEAMCSVLASELIGSVMQQFGISDQLLLRDDKNLFMKNFNKTLKSLVETAFQEILVHVISNVEEKEFPSNENHPKSLVAINAMLQLNNIVELRLNGLKKELAKLALSYPQDTESYKHEVNRLFAGMASDLHDFIGINPFKHLPLNEFPAGDSFKDILWTSMKSAVFPEVIYKVYQDAMDWQSKLQISYEQLDKCYHTSHPKWACKVLAQYSTDFIRHYLLNSNEEAAKQLLDNLKTYFGSSKDPSGAFVVNSLKELKSDPEFLISQNLQAIAETEDPQFAAVWPAFTRYSEAIYAKFFADFSKTVSEIELENPDFMVDIAIQILMDTAEHFSSVARATEEAEADRAYEVPVADMLAAFGADLHDGVPLDPSDPDDAKNLVRLRGCFIPLAAKLLKLANISIKDFPTPVVMRQQFGELAANKIFPMTLMGSFQKALEPQVRNALMLNFVQILYAALNGVEPQKREGGLKEASSHPNPKQKHLYDTCGSVVLELIKLIPDTSLQYVFMKEKVKNMSAETIGDAIMPYLSRWTLLQMIDTVIYSGLPNFHASKWEGKLGKEDLVPRKAFVRPDGKMELKPVKDFKFDFPKTPAEIKAIDEAKLNEASEVRRELRDAFTKTISQQLHAKVWAFIKSMWLSLQEQLNDFIERMFPENGRETKAMLDKIFGKIFFDVIGSILHFLATPFISLIKLITEKTVIDRRSEDIIENLESEVLENLFYKWTDTVIDALIKLQGGAKVKRAAEEN